MKHQLQGFHNSNLDAARGRLVRDATWKKQRVVTIVPADKDIPTKVCFSIWNLMYPPNNNSYRHMTEKVEVGEAYSNAIRDIIAHPELSKWEYILTVEHDNTPPSDGLLNLIKRMEENPQYAAIGGLYFTKGEGGVAQIWGDVKDPVLNFRPQIPVPGQLVECCGTGMGFTLFRLKMFKDDRLRKPWFKTIANNEGIGTQDLYFWTDARKYGYRCAIDCSVLVGHYDSQTDIVW